MKKPRYKAKLKIKFRRHYEKEAQRRMPKKIETVEGFSGTVEMTPEMMKKLNAYAKKTYSYFWKSE